METTHTFLESCARLLQDHSCEEAASAVLSARKHIPNVPVVRHSSAEEIERQARLHYRFPLGKLA